MSAKTRIKKRLKSVLGSKNISRLRKSRLFTALTGMPSAKENSLRAALKEQTRLNKRMQIEIDKVPLHRYGSYTPGVQAWEQRWDASPGKRILLYAYIDASGSLYKWAEAINRHTDYAARLVTVHSHKFGYMNDLLMPFPDLSSRGDFDTLASEADIIHIKDEAGFLKGTNRLPADLFTRHNKPMVYTGHGGYMRKFASENAYQDYVRGFDARIVMTPDLNYEWVGARYIPHAIDTDANTFLWSDNNILCHSPTHFADPVKKGTHFLTDALANIERKYAQEWAAWQLDLIHGVSFSECMIRKKKSSLFFDQAGMHSVEKFGIDAVIGWYGNSAIEAMAFGIPTIAHLSESAWEGAARGGHDIRNVSPIINIERSNEAMEAAILNFIRMPAAERRALAERTRQWAVDFHSYQACAGQLADVYDNLLRRHGLSRNITAEAAA